MGTLALQMMPGSTGCVVRIEDRSVAAAEGEAAAEILGRRIGQSDSPQADAELPGMDARRRSKYSSEVRNGSRRPAVRPTCEPPPLNALSTLMAGLVVQSVLQAGGMEELETVSLITLALNTAVSVTCRV